MDRMTYFPDTIRILLPGQRILGGSAPVTESFDRVVRCPRVVPGFISCRRMRLYDLPTGRSLRASPWREMGLNVYEEHGHELGYAARFCL
jgi:hypothetical protein